MKKSKLPLAVPIIVALMTVSFVVGSMIYMQKSIPMTARIKTSGDFTVWFDEACTITATGYDWGEFDIIDAGDHKYLFLWIKSEANAPVVITWSLTDGGWATDGTIKFSLYHPNSIDPEWRFDGIKDVDVPLSNWYPENSVEPSTDYTLSLGVGQVQGVRFCLKAFQSSAVYESLEINLLFTSRDIYP